MRCSSKQTVDTRKPGADYGVSLNTTFRINHLETALISEHDTVIRKYDKKVGDYSLNVCICCERLFRRSKCTKEYIDGMEDNLVWLAIKAFSYISQPDLDEGQSVYLCNHCKPKIKGNVMPARCVLNGR